MTQTMYPRKGKGMSEAQWQNIGRAIGDGIIDDGGWPYGLTNRNSVDNTVTLGVDTGEGFAAAMLSGFMHHMDAPEVIPVPAVSVDTTYEIGLAYDPLAHETEDGPLRLTAWTLPADYDSGKVYLTFYRIIRRPNVSLADSAVIEYRPRLSSGVRVVTNTSGLPRSETTPTDTIILVRETNAWYRLANNGVDPASWIEVAPEFPDDVISDVRNATYAPTGGTIAKRTGAGTIHVMTGTSTEDAANKGYVDNGLSKKANTSHTHGASAVTSGQFAGDRIRYSAWAYNTAWGGSGTVRTVHVVSGSYELCFYSSTARHKTNVVPFDIDPRDALAVEPVEFDRIDPETGEPTGVHDLGVVAEQGGKHLPMFVQYADEPDEDGNPVVEGWDYFRWTTAHQVVNRWNAARVDATVEAVKRIAEQTGVDISDLIPKMEG